MQEISWKRKRGCLLLWGLLQSRILEARGGEPWRLQRKSTEPSLDEGPEERMETAVGQGISGERTDINQLLPVSPLAYIQVVR